MECNERFELKNVPSHSQLISWLFRQYNVKTDGSDCNRTNIKYGYIYHKRFSTSPKQLFFKEDSIDRKSRFGFPDRKAKSVLG